MGEPRRIRVGYVGPGLAGKMSCLRSVFEHFEMGRDEPDVVDMETWSWVELVLDRWALEDASGRRVVVELAGYSTNLWDPPGFGDYLESLDLIVFVADDQAERFAANLMMRARVSRMRPDVPVFVFVNHKPSATDASVSRVLKTLHNEPRVIGSRVGTPEEAFEVLEEAVRLALVLGS